MVNATSVAKRKYIDQKYIVRAQVPQQSKYVGQSEACQRTKFKAAPQFNMVAAQGGEDEMLAL